MRSYAVCLGKANISVIGENINMKISLEMEEISVNGKENEEYFSIAKVEISLYRWGQL